MCVCVSLTGDLLLGLVGRGFVMCVCVSLTGDLLLGLVGRGFVMCVCVLGTIVIRHVN